MDTELQRITKGSWGQGQSVVAVAAFTLDSAGLSPFSAFVSWRKGHSYTQQCDCLQDGPRPFSLLGHPFFYLKKKITSGPLIPILW